MKRVLPFVAFWLLIGVAGPVAADQIVIIQSAQLRPFEEAVQGFKRTVESSGAHRGPKKVLPIVFRSLPLPGPDASSSIVQQVRNLAPDLVLAVGSPALEQLRDLREIPIVYLLVHTPAEWLRGRSDVTGVGMTISPERWFDAIRSAFPGRTRLGVLYDPERTGGFVREAEAAAGQGVSLVTRAVDSPREFYDRLRGLIGLVDAFWMLPDPSVVTPQTAEALFLFSLRQNVPVITFSEQFLAKGATVALLLDFDAMGQQAGEMARRLLDGALPEQIPVESPTKLHLRVNRTVAERLGVAFHISPGEPDDRTR